MFTPNLIGQIERRRGRDIHGRPVLAAPVACAFAVVNAKRKSEKTTVRADSSGSRGSADEMVADLAKILIAKHELVSIGDVFSFDGDRYEIISVHIRRSVAGIVDHFECDLEVLPR